MVGSVRETLNPLAAAPLAVLAPTGAFAMLPTYSAYKPKTRPKAQSTITAFPGTALKHTRVKVSLSFCNHTPLKHIFVGSRKFVLAFQPHFCLLPAVDFVTGALVSGTGDEAFCGV